MVRYRYHGGAGSILQVLLAMCLALLSLGASAAPAKVLLVLGDSLSAGYGLPAQQAWPQLLQPRLKQSGWQLVNASVSGETSGGGLQRLPALIARHKPAAIVIALGSNDGLQGMPAAQLEANLQRMLTLAKAQGARVQLVGVRLPPNYGEAYNRQLSDVFSRVSRAQKLPLTPYLLVPLGATLTYFQPDQLHPTASGQQKVADYMWQQLQGGVLGGK